MFFQNNKNLDSAESFKQCISPKNANRFLVAKFSVAKIIVICTALVFSGTTPLNAQIENELYGEQLASDPTAISSLMLAVSSNDVDGVKFFSRAGGFLINQKNIGGATALHIASRNGNLEIVNILLANGADVNLADNEGFTPLMRACISKNAKVVETLLNKQADVAALNSSNESVIIQAALANCADCINEIFTKSNLIKSMDTRLLKEQLVDAFVIARNHENQQMQNLLEGYLDRVSKMAPLTTVSANKTIIVADDSGNKIKYILNNNNAENNSDEKIVTVTATSINPTNSSLPQNKTTTSETKKSVVGHETIAAILLSQNKTLPKNAEIAATTTNVTPPTAIIPNSDVTATTATQTINDSANNHYQRQFKFVAGQASQLNPKEEIQNSTPAVKQQIIKYKITSSSDKLDSEKSDGKSNIINKNSNKLSGYKFIAGEKKKRVIRKKILNQKTADEQKKTEQKVEQKVEQKTVNTTTAPAANAQAGVKASTTSSTTSNSEPIQNSSIILELNK